MIATSPDLMPVSRCSSIIAQIWGATWGRTASMNASGTGLTGSLSRASLRPFWSPETDLSPWWTLGGTSSSETAQAKARTMWRTRLLIFAAEVGLDHRLPDRFQRLRPEVASRGVAV